MNNALGHCIARIKREHLLLMLYRLQKFSTGSVYFFPPLLVSGDACNTFDSFRKSHWLHIEEF